MTRPHAILIVPTEGDPHGLLREGPFDARPPTAHEHTHKDGGLCWRPACRRARLLDGLLDSPRDRRGLMLAWDGEVVVDGVDRAFRRLYLTGTCVGWSPRPSLEDVMAMARVCREQGLGAILFLNAYSREIPCAGEVEWGCPDCGPTRRCDEDQCCLGCGLDLAPVDDPVAT